MSFKLHHRQKHINFNAREADDIFCSANVGRTKSLCVSVWVCGYLISSDI